MPLMKDPVPIHTGDFARDSLNLHMANARNAQVDLSNRQEAAAWTFGRQRDAWDASNQRKAVWKPTGRPRKHDPKPLPMPPPIIDLSRPQLAKPMLIVVSPARRETSPMPDWLRRRR